MANEILDSFEYSGGPVEIYKDHLTIYSRTLALFKTKMVPKDVIFAQIKLIERHGKNTLRPGLSAIHIDTGAKNKVINRLENEMDFKSDEEMNEAYAKIMKHYQAYLDEKSGAVTINQISAADELKKFKELMDAGVISQEVFDAKKKQLLGL